MGKKDQERFEKTGMVFRDGKFVRQEVIEKVAKVAVVVLQSQSVSNHVKFLSDALDERRLSADRLRKAIESEAPGNMRSGAKKIIKAGKALTVDSLLTDYYNEDGFRALATRVGLDEAWFRRLAESECQYWESRQGER